MSALTPRELEVWVKSLEERWYFCILPCLVIHWAMQEDVSVRRLCVVRDRKPSSNWIIDRSSCVIHIGDRFQAHFDQGCGFISWWFSGQPTCVCWLCSQVDFLYSSERAASRASALCSRKCRGELSNVVTWLPVPRRPHTCWIMLVEELSSLPRATQQNS